MEPGHVKGLVAALVDAAAELAEVLALGGKAAWPTPDLDMPKRKTSYSLSSPEIDTRG